MKGFFKKAISIVLAAVMLFGAPLGGLVGLDIDNVFDVTASATSYSGTCGTNVNWYYDNQTGILDIIGHGATNSYSAGNAPWYSYSSNIKKVVIHEGITTIGQHLFYYHNNLTEVVIPDTVTSIEQYAFQRCSSLNEINLPDSVTNINTNAFESTGLYNNTDNWENGVLYIGKWLIKAQTTIAGNYTIKDGTTVICSKAFLNCKNLTGITVPDSVTSINSQAFYNCSNLENVNLGNEIKRIGEDVFGNTKAYTCIENGMYYIGDYLIKALKSSSYKNFMVKEGTRLIADKAFYDFDYITSIVIPDSVKYIGQYAFYRTIALQSVDLGEGVIEIGTGAFSCSGIVNSDLKSIVIPESVEKIGDSAFYMRQGLANITIGNGVKSIGSSAFDSTAYYNNTENRTDGVLYIGDYLIKSFSDITESYNVKEGTRCIAYGAFQSNTTLKVVRIPSGTVIGNNAFYNATNLSRVVLNDGVEKIGDNAFYGCTSLASASIPSSVSSVGNNAFYNCTKLASVTIANGVNSIGDYAFYSTIITEVTVPASVKKIGVGAFKNCRKLETAALTDGVENVGAGVFDGCTSLKSVILSSAMTEIKPATFMNCSVLTEIVFPSELKSIGGNAFRGCTALASPVIPSKVEYIGPFAFYGCKVFDEITIPASVKIIEGRAFYDCTVLSKLTLAEGVEFIGPAVFNNCTSLADISLPDSLTRIGENAFSNTAYYNATENWVNDVLYIDNHLVKANTSIAGDYEVAAGTKTVADHAFYGCAALTSITTCEGLVTVGARSFYNCSGLKTASIEEGAVTIGEQAFANCTNLESINIPSTVKAIEDYSFENATYFNDVYYNGGEKDWAEIEVYPNNSYLLNAIFHFAYHYIIWNIDGKEIVDRIKVGANVVAPTDTAKEYYTFTGWDAEVPATMPEKDLSFTAHYTPIVYNADFKIDGEVFETVNYTVETEAIESPVLPKRDGYSERWESYTLTPGGITVDAVYTVIIYNAVFTADDKTVSTIPYTVETESITPPEIPEKAGYTSKWADYELAIGGVTVNAIYTPITYYATFVIDGEIVATIPYTVETESFVAPTLPVREGYTESWEDYELTIGGITVNAIYSINPHTVTWNVDGEETTDNYNYGDTIVKPANPEKEGYTFTGWDAEIPATVPDEDLTFTATWKVNNYTVTWNVDGVIKTENYDYGTKLVKPANPVKEGYTFIGWTNDVPATMPANNLEFVAEWSINPHTVTWVVDNEKTTDTYNFGDTIVKPADPEKEGYTFTGWDAEIPATVPDKDLAFTATWKVNNYTVTWNVDGVIKTENYDYGTKIVKPATPEKIGYTFKDWTISVPATMPANNLDFVATWTINTYSIKWNIGDTVETTEFDYGEPVVPPEVNVDGYEFIKWIPDVPEIMPAENLEFTAMLASTAFDSGWGTEDNPYIISTKEQLDEARNHLGSSFRLANDIVFTENDFASGGVFYNGGRGWTPINLYGTFDGDGHVIKGLKINARITASTEYPYIGLFGLVSGTIKNLGLVDGEINVTVTNADEAIIGGIIAFADDESIIDNCFNTCDINVMSSRTITVNSNNRNFMDGLIVGGIIGTGYIDVRNCFNNGDITIDSTVKITPSSYYTAKIEIMPVVGGITGGYSTAKDCYNTGDIDVTVTANRGGTTSFVPKDDLSLIAMAGGISGTMSDVSNCYNEGNISATINDNYKSSNKFNIAAAGGIVSAIGETETVSACYNIGKVSGSTYEGAIAAYSEGTVKDCYYLNNNDVGVGYGEDVTVPCTPEEMASESTYEGFDFDGTWVIGVNGAPKLGGNIVTTEKIEISDAELSVANKETAQLTANLVPAYSTYNGIIWSSSNEEVATVDGNGLITAKKIGETTIKATSADGKAFAECIVTVTPADFTIIWIVDGKETEETVTETNTIVKPETPVKYGYTFSGWTPDVPDVMPDENLIFNGSFIPIECELVFDATTGAFADGTTKKIETIDFDAQINAPEAPSKAGYIFLGWALNNVNVGTDLGIMDDVDGKRFTAVWVPSTDTRYTVETYTMNTEGEYVKNVQYFTGETDSTVNAEYDIKTGFALNREKSVLNGTIAADNSLVLKVYIDRNKYTFTTVVDGVSTTKEYLYESTVEKPLTPTKTGYTFVDWDKSAPSTMPAKNVTITAEFDANSYNARFNANGGSWINSTVVRIVATDFDSKIIAPENPTRQGYDFAGWDPEVGVMDDVNGKTFKANWTARNDTKYIVEIYTMDVDGTYTVSKETKKGTTDTTASVTANTSTGFTLNLDKSKLSGTIAADGSLVLKIYYDRNKYSFTKVIENSTIVEKIYFDAPMAKPANPVKPGYKFTGWDNTIPSKMPANDVTVTAKFELSFKMSIRNPSTTTISYGDSIILHADMNEALPSGWIIKWTADNGNFSYSANGETCTITPSKSGDTTFTATIYDENGNEISKDTQTMKSKAGFFDKFAAFFRKLFGMTKIIQQSINF